MAKKKRTRATDDEAKRERKRAIVDAALALFEALDDYHAVTMSNVAREAGLAKGTLYLYFDSKEELFLHALNEHLAEWFEELAGSLRVQPEGADPEQIGRIIAESLASHETLTRLLTRLHGTIEQNIEPAAAMAFKRRLRDGMLPMAELLESRVEQLGPGEGLLFLLRANAIIIGLHELANPAPAAAQALKAIDLAMFRVDFVDELAATLAALLRGWR